ncbi:Urease accessory protein UreF [Thalassocella blandensis]|nr:Urease accessory protein UreF [Thalassocella blandensis]
MQNLSLLKLLHLVSPALPIGAYAYSQGQEWAVDKAWIKKPEEVEAWLTGLLQHGVAQLDLPALIRLYCAWENDDVASVRYWNQFVLACRETQELLLEDQQLGIALSRLLVSLDIARHEKVFSDSPSLVSMFALAGVSWHIPCDELLQGYCWSWMENQVAAATKTVPLGQTQAQQILQRAMTAIPHAVSTAKQVEDDNMGLGLPGLAIASSMHERQYSRLFRS